MGSAPLSPLTAAGWGLVGGFIVEALELAGALRRGRALPWKRPGEPRLPAYLTSVVLRLAAGSALAAVFGADEQIAGPFAAGTLGITAPLVIEKLLGQAGTTPEETTAPSATPGLDRQRLSRRQNAEAPDAR